MNRDREQGVALILVMMTITLLATLVSSLTIATITETAVAANYRDATDTLYAAEAAVEYVLQEIARVEDWGDLLAEPGQSRFVDGPPAGIRKIGTTAIDLTDVTLEVARMATSPTGMVHGPSVLHAFGWFRDMASPAADRSRVYVAVWLADRSPSSVGDDTPPEVLSVVGRAFGGGGAHRAVEAIVERADIPEIRVLRWRGLL